MANQKIDQLILELENYLECWKQFNHYLNLARSKQFTQEDENQFLEIKSVLTQGLEVLLAAFETGSPSRETDYLILYTSSRRGGPLLSLASAPVPGEAVTSCSAQ